MSLLSVRHGSEKEPSAAIPKRLKPPPQRLLIESLRAGERMRYTVILEQEADGGYVASVPALPGCVSQGDSREEALRNIREAVELYIEDCLEAGDPVPKEDG